MSLLPTIGAVDQDTGFYNGVATQSLRFDDGSSAFLSRTPSSAGNRKTWTWSGWLKRGVVGGSHGLIESTSISFGLYLDKLFITVAGVGNGLSTAVFRDSSAWYHVLIAFDTTQASSADRVKFYVNGTQHSLDNTRVSQNTDYNINNTTLQRIGVTGVSGSTTYIDGYLSEVNFIDGSALAPTSFGETKNGVWIPIKYTGSYGTNGFRLQFASTTHDAPASEGNAETDNIGADSSGENNHWTASDSIGAEDCNLPDSPENNFSTWNALWTGGEQSASIATAPTLSNGNLEVSLGQNAYIGNNFRPVSGKWYCEIRVKTIGSTNGEIDWGWLQATTYAGTTGHAGQANKWGAYYHAYSTDHIQVYDETSQLGSNINLTISAGSVLQLAWDIDNNKGWVGIDNTYYAADNGTDGNPSSGTNQTFTFTADEAQNLQVYIANGTSTDVHVANFGQDSTFGGDETATTNADANGIGAFHHAPPTGFLACCSANLSDDDLPISPNADTQADNYFNTVLYNGLNSTAQDITVGFVPDWVWIKTRNAAISHMLYDSNRGATKFLQSVNTGAEATGADSLTDFDVSGGGFSLGVDSSTTAVNNDGKTYVAWNWKANGGTTSTIAVDSVSSGVPSIASTVQANTTAGFSIVTYNIGSSGVKTVGHGLTKAPEVIINKGRDQTSAWWTFTTVIDGTLDYLRLDEATAKADDSLLSVPTSSVFSQVENYTLQQNVVSYCFHSVEGYSKFGSYTGNGSTDGTFVFTNFAVKWLMVKRTNSAVEWTMLDSARSPFNVRDKYMYANTTMAEDTHSTVQVDFLSNGFKSRGTFTNVSGGIYIYMAFAENPFKYANAR